ncbi:CRM1 C terminal-domain-containing protein [Lentinula edodes]|nr:CRM1 C terminal-domain-containing protein [Lentinula edodes]
MLGLYKTISGMISEVIAKEGVLMAKTPQIRQLRALKKDILKLMQTYINSVVQIEVVNENFIPLLLDAVLGDYQRNIAAARDAEVLNLMSDVVRCLGAQPFPPPKDKFEEFDAMLADGNRGIKVITLNGALHTAFARGSPKTSSDSDNVEVQMVPRFGKDRETGHANGLRIGHGPGGQGHHDDQSYTQSSKQSLTSGGDLDASYTSESYNFPHADAEEDPEFKTLTLSVPNSQLGYFDLHPERKRPEAMLSRDADMFASGGLNGHSDIDDDVDADDIEAVEVGEVDEDDPRARYAHGSDDAPRDLDKLYAAKTEKARPLPSLPPDHSLLPLHFLLCQQLHHLDRFLSLTRLLLLLLHLILRQCPFPTSPLSHQSLPLWPLTSTFGSTSGTPGKTAALIEMYREKEKRNLTTLNCLSRGGGSLVASDPRLSSSMISEVCDRGEEWINSVPSEVLVNFPGNEVNRQTSSPISTPSRLFIRPLRESNPSRIKSRPGGPASSSPTSISDAQLTQLNALNSTHGSNGSNGSNGIPYAIGGVNGGGYPNGNMQNGSGSEDCEALFSFIDVVFNNVLDL